MRLFYFIFALIIIGKAEAQVKGDFYYFIINSSHYNTNFTEYKSGFEGFINIPYGKESCDSVLATFKKLRATKGIILSSTEKKPIKKIDIHSAIDSLASIINNDNSSNPVLLIYWIGHGIADSLMGHQYFIPGDFNMNIADASFTELSENAIILPSVTSLSLKNKKVKIFALFDCCFTYKQYSEIGFKKFKDKFGILLDERNPKKSFFSGAREKQLYKDYSFPIFTSSIPSESSSSFPLYSDSSKKIGILAASFLEAIERCRVPKNNNHQNILYLIYEMNQLAIKRKLSSNSSQTSFGDDYKIILYDLY